MTDFANWLHICVDEYDREQDASEYAHECADNSAFTIYHGKAYDLVLNSHHSVVDQAEQQMLECGFEYESLDATMCLVAYWICYNELLELLGEVEDEESDND